MTEDDWNRYRPDSIGIVKLSALVAVLPDRAVFRAFLETGTDSESESRFVWLFDTDDQTAGSRVEARVNRWLEAMFFDDPNLLRVYAAGQIETADASFSYAITEPFDRLLSSTDLPRPLDFDTLRRVLMPVCAGLAWLHSQDLVYCALRGESIVEAEGTWKLADFSELRLAGRAPAEETRRLMIRRDLYVPPEAYEGVVLPAWDSWSLGLLIQNLYAREARAAGRNPRTVPSQQGALIRELGDTDPMQRLSVESVAARLAGPPDSPEPQSEPPDPEPPVAEIVQPAEPPADLRGKQIRVLAAVALVFAAVVILASVYGNPPHPGMQARHASVRPAAPAAAAPVVEKSVAAPGAQSDPAAQKRAISALLDRWVDSTRQRNAAAQAECYAPIVQQFYGRHDVTSEQVKRAKERAFGEVGPAREFSIADLHFEQITPDRAVISFLKNWDFPQRHFAGSTREEMVIRYLDGAWKISSEREVNPSASRGSPAPGPAGREPGQRDSALSASSTNARVTSP